MEADGESNHQIKWKLTCVSDTSNSNSNSNSNSSSNHEEEKEMQKKLKKKYMKQGVAMAQSYLQDSIDNNESESESENENGMVEGGGGLQLDPSIIDIEIVLDAQSIVQTDGCIVSCFLDAGCDKIVIPIVSKDDILALDVSRVPKNRIVAHLDSNHWTLLEHSESTSQNQSRSETQSRSENQNKSGASFTVNEDIVKQIATFTDTISLSYHVLSRTEESNIPVNSTIHNMKNIIQQLHNLTQGQISTILELHTKPNHHQVDTTESVYSSSSTSTSSTIASPICQIVQSISQYTGEKSTFNGTLTLVDPNPHLLGTCYASCIRTDRPDKLYTTVVCTRSNEALGLVYSSISSIIAALQCGRGVYYSRSRGGLWRKGDTSGHYQTLHRIDVDCDGDALRFTVTQNGPSHDTCKAFCHLKTLTCWGEPRGVRHLETTLASRLRDAPPGSYTKRLFDDETLLRDKLVEEAQELSECANDEPKHVAEELADVLYFAMVKAVKAGVSLDDAVQELDRRARKVTRRKGDSKAFRIEAGNAILGKKE